MLALRPNCECCDRDLPPDSADARICAFCPNCHGKLVRRPTGRILKPEGCEARA